MKADAFHSLIHYHTNETSLLTRQAKSDGSCLSELFDQVMEG